MIHTERRANVFMPFGNRESQARTRVLHVIDRQHEEICKAVARLRRSILGGSGLTTMCLESARLIKVTILHFESEEAFLEEIGYPQALEDRQQHQQFMKELQKVEKHLSEKEITAPLELLRLFAKWLKSHLEGADEQYVRFAMKKQ